MRGACMKYGAAKAEREKLERKISATNRLINMRADPEQELLEKLDTYMDLKDKLDENNSKDAVRKHRAKVLMEGEKPTKYFCSLQKVVGHNRTTYRAQAGKWSPYYRIHKRSGQD